MINEATSQFNFIFNSFGLLLSSVILLTLLWFIASVEHIKFIMKLCYANISENVPANLTDLMSGGWI